MIWRMLIWYIHYLFWVGLETSGWHPLQAPIVLWCPFCSGPRGPWAQRDAEELCKAKGRAAAGHCYEQTWHAFLSLPCSGVLVSIMCFCLAVSMSICWPQPKILHQPRDFSFSGKRNSHVRRSRKMVRSVLTLEHAIAKRSHNATPGTFLPVKPPKAQSHWECQHKSRRIAKIQSRFEGTLGAGSPRLLWDVRNKITRRTPYEHIYGVIFGVWQEPPCPLWRKRGSYQKGALTEIQWFRSCFWGSRAHSW